MQIEYDGDPFSAATLRYCPITATIRVVLWGTRSGSSRSVFAVVCAAGPRTEINLKMKAYKYQY
jgi:hypothetical protein